MRLLAVTDIFGATPAFKAMVAQLANTFAQIEIVDPYGGHDPAFMDEEEAYIYFQDRVGLDKYAQLLLQRCTADEATLFLGFSVGASAIWSISEMPVFHHGSRALCFYGSQIRNLLSITPQIPMDVYFPFKENHFDVQDLMSKIGEKNRVRCFQTPYLHGFMNKQSRNFQPSGLAHYLGIIAASRLD